jgi:hypothetical protein
MNWAQYSIIAVLALVSVSSEADCPGLLENRQYYEGVFEVLKKHQDFSTPDSMVLLIEDLNLLGIKSKIATVAGGKESYIEILPSSSGPLGRFAKHAQDTYGVPFLIGKPVEGEGGLFIFSIDPSLTDVHERNLFIKRPVAIIVSFPQDALNPGEAIEVAVQHEFVHGFLKRRLLGKFSGSFHGVVTTPRITGYPVMSLEELPAYVSTISSLHQYAERLKLAARHGTTEIQAATRNSEALAKSVLMVSAIVKRQSENAKDILKALEKGESLNVKERNGMLYLSNFYCPNSRETITQVIGTGTLNSDVKKTMADFYRHQQALYAELDDCLHGLGVKEVNEVLEDETLNPRFFAFRWSVSDFENLRTRLSTVLPAIRKAINRNL